jgi:hypothetical protein
MAMFPTNNAVRLAKDAGLGKLTRTEFDINDAIADFQKIASVSTFENALSIFQSHIYNHSITEAQESTLKRIFDFTQFEINGLVIDHVGRVMTDSKLESNKLLAARVLTDIRNGDSDDIDEKTVKKIVFEMVKK